MTPEESKSIDERARKRDRAMVYFLISLVIFVTTSLLAFLRSHELSGSGTGGDGGFVVLGQYLITGLLTLLGLAASVVFAGLSMSGWRGGTVLFVAELSVLLFVF